MSKYFQLDELYRVQVTGFQPVIVKLFFADGEPILKKEINFMHYGGGEMMFWVEIPGGLDGEVRTVMFKVSNLPSVHTQKAFNEHLVRFTIRCNRVVMEFCVGCVTVSYIENAN